MPKLRKLKFDTFDAIADDIRTLQESGYEQGGAWNLSQIGEHLGNVIEVGLRGGLAPQAPWIIRATVLRALFDYVIATNWMPSGATAPPEIQPQDRDGEDAAAIERCLALLAEARDRTDPIPPSPLVVGLRLPKWKKLQRVHSAHHLSFLRPNAAEDAPAS